MRDLSGLSYIEVAHIHPLREGIARCPAEGSRLRETADALTRKLSALSAKCDLRTRSK